MAEFAIQNELEEEPSFAWWVSCTIKKKNRMISKVKLKCWEKTHECRIRIPKTVKEAIGTDKENGNTSW